MTGDAEFQPTTAAAQIAASMAAVAENVAPIFEAAVGYRQRAIDAGFDPESASRVAADFHRFTIAIIINGLVNGTKKDSK